MDDKKTIVTTETIDLSTRTSSELEDMARAWSAKIIVAEEALQVVYLEHSELRKKLIDLSDALKKGRDNVKRLEREKGDIRSAMFRKMREGA